jgi:hypothetical protein
LGRLRALLHSAVHVQRVLGPRIEALRTKDYQRSEFNEPELITLTEKTALVRGVAVRYRASETEPERLPVSYLVHQTGARWKIAVVASALNFIV